LILGGEGQNLLHSLYFRGYGMIKTLKDIDVNLPEGKLLIRAIGFIMGKCGFNSVDQTIELLNTHKGGQLNEQRKLNIVKGPR
jgi:hypothetical protein